MYWLVAVTSMLKRMVYNSYMQQMHKEAPGLLAAWAANHQDCALLSNNWVAALQLQGDATWGHGWV